MDDNAPQEKSPPADLNKIDLSALSSFSFGTSWVQDKSTPNERRSREGGDDRPRRDGGGGAPERRDRRAFNRPAGGPGPGAGPGAGAGAGAPSGYQGAGPGGGAPERREFSGERPPYQRDGQGQGEFRGGPRRDGPGGPGGGERGGRFGGWNEQPVDRGPYDSPYFTATFYPEDTSFNTLVQTIRKSCRTIELFEVARTVVAKSDRFVVVLTRKNAGDPGVQSAPVAGAPAGFVISVPDGLPFENEEAALAHVLSKHLGNFFDSAEVEIEPPKGNFQVVNRCGVTGELLGPPNYHLYNQLVQQHYAAKVSRTPFEAFKARIESVREPEAIQAWLDKMKKATRYTWKQASAPTAAPTAAAPAAPVEGEPAAESPAAPAAPAAQSAEAPAAPAAVSFDSFDEAKAHLLATAKDKVIRSVEQARLHGKNLEVLPQGEIHRAIEGALERQRRFPLDTANALRGRLRREHFTIFKKGSKGVSYVCAVKRKFRVPGQTFSDSIGALISFIEAHPMVKAGELGKKFLNIAPPPTAEAPAPDAPVAAPVEHALTIEQRDKLARMQSDLPWLVREGYVTEFIDGALYAPLAMVESRKREVEASEHDPENFPDAPAPAPSPAPAAAKAPEPVVAEAVPAESVATEPVATEVVTETQPDATEVAPAAAAEPVTEEPKTEPPAVPAT
jgi:hypothetical protein